METSVNTYCKLLSECRFHGVITQLLDHFVTIMYKMIFEQDPPCMSKASMEAPIDIEDWYASPFGTFIWMYSTEKPPDVLPKFSTNKLVMQEVSSHISVGLSARIHRIKKAPWPTLPLWIRLYEIKNLNHENVEREEFKKFNFGT